MSKNKGQPGKGSRKSSSGGMSFVRATLVAFNLLTMLAGVATLSIGMLLFYQSQGNVSGMELLNDVSQDKAILPNQGQYKEFSIILVIFGSLVALVSFLGVFGSCINSRCLLLTYLISVGLILCLQFLVSVFAIVYRQPVSAYLRKELLEIIQNDYSPTDAHASTWATIHQLFMCCGVDGFSDWFKIEAWPEKEYVPDSCCVEIVNNTGCGQTINPNLWYKQGCLANIQFTILEKLHYLASAIITLVFLQLYGIIASTLLFYHIKEPKLPIPNHSSKPFKDYSYERART